MQKVLYKPFVSKAKNKKYSVYVKADNKSGIKLINFGLKGSQVFYQHKDKARQKSYLARAKGIKNAKNELTWKLKDTPNYWSVLNWADTKPSWA